MPSYDGLDGPRGGRTTWTHPRTPRPLRLARSGRRPVSERPLRPRARLRAGPPHPVPAGSRRPKTVENRLHIDLHAAPGEREAAVAGLAALDTTVLRQVKQARGEFTAMTGPGGHGVLRAMTRP
ncbi:VOC family protein [Streptomyces sp. NPDC006632]|uniref:VOC family protein n=1 Tax=Streptomyces sp. NPDC006632 TaxID=3157182 RepID=UPI0033A050FB